VKFYRAAVEGQGTCNLILPNSAAVVVAGRHFRFNSATWPGDPPKSREVAKVPVMDTTVAARFGSTARRDRYDAVVVGSGPNGLAAAVCLARAGRSVLVVESADTPGGGTRTAELTEPGFWHDVCSAVHPLAAASPFFREIELERHGLSWCWPDAPAAQPLDDGTAVIAERSLEDTAAGLGADGKAWRKLFDPLVRGGDAILDQTLGPFKLPRRPLLMARFGLRAMPSARSLVRRWFRTEAAGGLFAGMAAHSIMPLERPLTAAIGLMLGLTAHHVGWPVARGGSQAIADALVRCLLKSGGEVVTGWRVETLGELPPSRAVLFDTSPRAMARLAGNELPADYRKKLERFRHGPGVFKIDWALDGPIPWKAEACLRASTVHVGGSFEQVAQAERAAWENRPAEEPFLLVAQQSLFDPTRAPQGKHTAWGYCHVAPGSTFDMTERIERQMEKYAPGFRDRVIGRHVMAPADFERYNPNCVGGDIGGGVMDLGQLFTRPVSLWNPYATPNERLFLCSASTPPGSGVHGMCGYHAARAALRGALRE
jgi:phytoene dehydrogenase-like protein